MNSTIDNTRIIKPYYESHNTPSSINNYISLTVFDKVNYNVKIGFIFAYRPPNPPNESLELSLRKALSIFRSFAGRLINHENGDPIILLNDEGVKFVEASVDGPLDELIFEPSRNLEMFHPIRKGVDELLQVQLTRFSCGSLVVGFVFDHLVDDAKSVDMFLITWGQTTRGVDIGVRPILDRNNVFIPRELPQFDQLFEHRGVEYISKRLRPSPSKDWTLDNEILVHKIRYSREFLTKIKIFASSQDGHREQPYSTFESLMGHLWRTITIARDLDEDETMNVQILIDGRMRLTPNVSNYFGNLILWSFPTSTVKNVKTKPLAYVAKLIHDSIEKVNDDYFKSFINFANCKVKEEYLIPTVNYTNRHHTPNVLVDSWLRLNIYEWNFGTGSPFSFTPAYMPVDGQIFLLPISPEDGSVDVVVSLFKDKLETFKKICYSQDYGL